MTDFTQDPIHNFEEVQKQMAPLTAFIKEFIAKTRVLQGMELDGLAFKKTEPAPNTDNKSFKSWGGTNFSGGPMMIYCKDDNGGEYWSDTPC